MSDPSPSQIATDEDSDNNDLNSDIESVEINSSDIESQNLPDFSLDIEKSLTNEAQNQHISILQQEEFYTDEGPPIEDEVAEKALQEIPDASSQEDNVFSEIKEFILTRQSASRSESSATDSDCFPHAKTSSQFSSIPFGIIPKASYEHENMCSDIMGVTYNERMRQFIILDGKGMTTWKRDAVDRRVNRVLQYPKYEYRLIIHLVYAKKYNCFFGLGRDFSIKVFNRDFMETCSVNADLRSVIFMIFNPLRDELITGGVGGTKVWQFHQQPGKAFGSLRPLANYGLSVKYELPHVGGGWVKRVELDYHLEHLYCCSDTSLHVYDLQGKELLKYERAHSMTITGCRFSKNANFLVTSSVDTEVKVWSLVGGLVHTFRGHSRAVTNLILHPLTSSIIITSSLDGSIRMWSLDTMECLYSLVVSVEGVLWMGQTDDNLLYLCTPRTLTLWNINYYTQFWALARSPVTHMSLHGSKNKSTRLLVVSEDSSVRLMARSSKKNLSTVLPPPCISPLEKVLSVSYSRDQNTMYLLVDSREIWVYTTRTDPSCRIATWEVSELQTKIKKSQLRPESVDNVAPVRFTFNRQPIPHRATESGYGGSQPISSCCCLAVLNSTALFWTAQGSQCTDQDSFLLLGLEDGRILFMDLVVKGQKYMELKTGKDPVLEIRHDLAHNSLTTLYKVKGMMLIHVWSLPNLELMHEVYTAPDLTSYARLNDYIMTGYTSGCVIFTHLEKAVDVGLHKARMLPPVEEILEVHHKPEHNSSVIAVDVCVALKLFCSCSNDGTIKIWTEDQAILTEIMMDTTLSCICFLNNMADLVVGFQKHIFFIDHTKVCPNVILPDSDVDSCDKESVIYEDPSVMFEGIIPYPDPMTLDSYLVPFDIEFSNDFLEGKMQNQPEPEVQEISESESRASMAPTEIYFSPEGTPRRRLSLIDLTVNSDISKEELFNYMEKTMEHLAEKEKKDKRQMLFEHKRETESKTSALRRKLQLRQKRMNKTTQENALETGDIISLKREQTELRFSFPKFGKSPGPTPEPSQPPTPDLLDLEDMSAQDDVTVKDSSMQETFKLDDKQTVEEDEISKFLRARKESKPVQAPKAESVAPRKKFGLSGISIDAETLMKDTKTPVKAKVMTNLPGRTPEPVQIKKVEPEPTTVEKKTKKEKMKQKRFVEHKRQKQRQQKEKDMDATEAPTQMQALELKELQLNASGETSLEVTDVSPTVEPLEREESTPESEDEEPNFGHDQFVAPSGQSSEFSVHLTVPELPTLPLEQKPVVVPKLSTTEAKAALMQKLNKKTTMDFSGINKVPKESGNDADQNYKQDSVGASQQVQRNNTEPLEKKADDAVIETRSFDNVELKESILKEKVSSVKQMETKEPQPTAVKQTEPVVKPEPRNIRQETVIRAVESPDLYDTQNQSFVSFPFIDLSLTPEPELDPSQKEKFQPRYLSTPGLDFFIDQSESWDQRKQVSGIAEEDLASVEYLEPGTQNKFNVQIHLNDQEMIDLRMKSAGQMHGENLLTDSEMYELWARPKTSVEKTKSGKANILGAEVPELQGHPKLAMSDFQTEHLQAAFEAAMKKYQRMARAGLVSEKLYKNDDQDFADNWHERQIERHMLLRMQKELRILNVHKKRQLLEQIKMERTKQHILIDHMTGKRMYYSHTAPAIRQRLHTTEESRHAITIPVPSPATSRPHTASPYYEDHMVASPKLLEQADIPPPTPSLQQQIQQALDYRSRQQELELNQREKTELGHKQPFRYRLSDSRESKKHFRTSQEMPLDFNPWQIDPRNPKALRPKSSKSIPSKCKYFALLTKPKIELNYPIPSPLEEQLLAERFPEQGEKVFKVYEGYLTRSPRRAMLGISYSPYEHQLYG
ncbi:uncharacterized protein LOC106056024 isoform X2 [Biomphalaria glabrata]|uniref:Uncharacterized protein LOC106056024 isoform X2 n=1 Tax=Biomphalaria glabrata TaxID=6526 RepID=A0A9W3A688_BIOGL|nr:uncharacterized protein LOC106056024 isoform X2 [Biomphalaria glabrata]